MFVGWIYYSTALALEVKLEYKSWQAFSHGPSQSEAFKLPSLDALFYMKMQISHRSMLMYSVIG